MKCSVDDVDKIEKILQMEHIWKTYLVLQHIGW